MKAKTVKAKPAQVTSVRSWNLNATDLEATVRFYRDVLGATESMTHTVQGAKVVRLSVGGFGLGVFDAAAGVRPGVPHHTFQVQGPADAETLVKQLAALGAKAEGTRQHQEDGGYSVYVSDPSGNRLELSYAG